jgi:hypothetical protein
MDLAFKNQAIQVYRQKKRLLWTLLKALSNLLQQTDFQSTITIFLTL